MPFDIKFAGKKTKQEKKNTREQFIEKQKNKVVKKAPKKQKMEYPELISKRSVNLLIEDAATNLRLLDIRYKKTTTGETKNYTVAPYEFAYKMLKVGRRKILWGYDIKDKHIKTYAVRNILGAKRNNKHFKPKWEVKIKPSK